MAEAKFNEDAPRSGVTAAIPREAFKASEASFSNRNGFVPHAVALPRKGP